MDDLTTATKIDNEEDQLDMWTTGAAIATRNIKARRSTCGPTRPVT